MNGPADFDIDPVVPHVDLVLFDNVLSCYPCDKDITANYTLGEAVRPTTWDWVGVFRTDWRYLGEYAAYSWVPNATDVTNLRRRGITFPSNSHKIQANDDEQYNFLYIAHGNHVVGVSSPFRVVDEEKLEEMGIEHLFSSAQEQGAYSDSGPNFHELTCSGFYDSYEIIDETIKPESGAVPKRKASCKRKITNVYRDSTTLVSLCPTWPEKLRILDVHPIVQEYMDNRLRSIVNSSTQQAVPVYDAQGKSKVQIHETSSKDSNEQQIVPSYIPSIEFPEIMSITAGPESFLLGLRSTTKTCPNCAIAKTLMKDLIEKDDFKNKRITDLEEEVRELKAKKVSRIDKEATVGILDWCLEQINDDNKVLRLRIRDLERLLIDERAKSLQLPLRPWSRTVDTGSLARTIHTEAKETQSSLPSSLQFTIDQDGWTYKEPRKVERLQRTVLRHNRTIELLHQTIEAKKYQINSLKEENLQLRSLLRSEKDQTQVFCKLADELNIRIKAVLAERAKDRTNEWRKFIVEARDKRPCPAPCPTPCPTPCLSSDSDSQERLSEAKNPNQTVNSTHSINSIVTRLEKHAKTKSHKKTQAEQCKTCGLKFSLKADQKVIQEHMNFHMRHRRQH